MTGPDSEPDPEWPIRPERQAPRQARTSETTVVQQRRNRGLWPILIALGGVILLVLVWLVVRNGNPDQDKLTGNETAATRAAADPAKRCASQSTYDAIKRELFARAAQLRGSDQAAFERLAAYAVLRMDNPVLENEDQGTGLLNCSGSASLDLPPGVAVVGGRTTLTSDIDYRVQRAADNSGDVVMLANADAIITPLATLTRTAAAQPQAAPPATQGQAPRAEGEVAQPSPATPVQPQAPQAPPATPQPQPQSRPAGARPSFNCDNARTRSELAICSSAGLASLDRTMSAQYGRAIANASPDERALLQQTRDRFLRYRDRCPDNACIGDAYVQRMREIRDIMNGSWAPPR